MKAPSLTLGIEEEYQIIDPKTRELQSYITQILKEDSVILGQIKPELHQSMVEIGTSVCQTPAEARAELVRASTGPAKSSRPHSRARRDERRMISFAFPWIEHSR